VKRLDEIIGYYNILS